MKDFIVQQPQTQPQLLLPEQLNEEFFSLSPINASEEEGTAVDVTTDEDNYGDEDEDDNSLDSYFDR